MAAPSCPQCGAILASACFLGTGQNGYYCAGCKSWYDTSLHTITRPDCHLVEVTP